MSADKVNELHAEIKAIKSLLRCKDDIREIDKVVVNEKISDVQLAMETYRSFSSEKLRAALENKEEMLLIEVKLQSKSGSPSLLFLISFLPIQSMLSFTVFLNFLIQ